MANISIVAPAPALAPPNIYDQFDGGSNSVRDRIVGVEGGGKNPNSTANGVGQFLDSTWLDMITKHRPEFAHLPKDQLLELRSNETLAKDMVGKYAEENSKALEQAGFAPTPGNVYLAHFAGGQGAIKILQSDPMLPVSAVLGDKVVAANPFLKDMTAGDLAAWASKKMGTSGGNIFDQFDAPKSSPLPAAKQAESPDDIVDRGSVLPIGRTRGGDLALAVPSILHGIPEMIGQAGQTVKDLLDGRPPSDLSGQEIANLGALVTGGSVASGTGRAIVRAAGVKQAEKIAADAFGPRSVVPETIVPKAASAKTAEELTTAKNDFYNQVDNSGVVFAPRAVQALVKDTIDAVKKAGIDKDLHPRAMTALNRLFEASGKPISITELDTLGKIIGNAGSTMDKSEGRIVGIMKSKFNDFIKNLTQKDVIAGDAKVVATALPKAKELHSRVERLDTISTLIERAKNSASNFSASGFENALRTQFRQLANNAKEFRTFPKDEQKAILKIARGTTASNTARNVGKMAPTGVVSLGIGSGLGAGAATAMGMSPVGGAIAVGSVGFAARKLATVLMQRNIRKLQKLVIEGGSSPLADQAIAKGNSALKELSSRTLQAATAQTIEPQPRLSIGNSALSP